MCYIGFCASNNESGILFNNVKISWNVGLLSGCSSQHLFIISINCCGTSLSDGIKGLTPYLKYYYYFLN